MPSHARTRNSSPSANSISRISGTGVTICASRPRPLAVLNSRSPIARDRLRLPIILPSATIPPAFSTLLSSSGFPGLWSSVIACAMPSRLHTHRESPALATRSLRPNTMATTAVQPAVGASGSSVSCSWGPLSSLASPPDSASLAGLFEAESGLLSSTSLPVWPAVASTPAVPAPAVLPSSEVLPDGGCSLLTADLKSSFTEPSNLLPSCTSSSRLPVCSGVSLALGS
mmetsp:Transcript_1655/g.4038  ORF Transcript_1655/g.4038 Transcript_1655/m.4038 type:complete len:228 (+) Transcript_1655:1323-2006(+)